MISNSSLRRLSLFLLLVFYLGSGSDAQAQISFVQISDPHLFDDTFDTVDNRWSDKAAFIFSIDKINRQLLQHNARYSFVVVTGDLGLEPLITGITDRKQIESNLRTRADELASMLVLSKVHRWLFVPGNNDLLNEDPKNIEYYHLFIDHLREITKTTVPDFEIRDLCPRSDNGSDQSRSDLLKIDRYAFIGFDDSSFKNRDKNAGAPGKPNQRRIDANASIQEKYVSLVRDNLNEGDMTYAYIFFHIPATDDPHLVSEKPEDDLKVRYAATEQIGGAYFYSAWFVDKRVREAWNSIVVNPRVKGLFAGHFHDFRKQTYQNLAWIKPDYRREEIEKLHICPPLALKFQNGEEEQARGFQEIYLDGEGAVSTRILWLDQAMWGVGPVQESAEETLALGRTFEGLDQLEEAKGAYAKAAESDWPPTRKAATEALTRVITKQESRSNKYFWSPLTSGLSASTTALWTAFISIILILVCAGLAHYPLKRLGTLLGRNRVRIGPVIDVTNGNGGIRFEQMAALVLKRIHSHFKPRRVIKSDFRLPMLVKSQSPEIKEILELAAPGGIGKLVGWVYNKIFDRPRYSIQGMTDSDALQRWLFITINDGGVRVHESKGRGVASNLAGEKRLAFRVLKRLIKHMNQ